MYQGGLPLFLWIQSSRYKLIAAVGLFLLISLIGNNEHVIQTMGGYRRFFISLLLITLVGLVACMTIAGGVARFLGDISYALYLMHPFVVFGLLPRLGVESEWINLVIVYGCTIPAAFLTHRYFEMPAQRYIRRLAHA